MNKRLFLILYLVASAILFTVPYLFDNMEPNQSVSYMVGFNNQAAVLMLFISGLFFFGLGIFDKDAPDCWILKNAFRADKVMLFTCLVTFLLISINGFIFNTPDFYGIQECGYFMHYVFSVENGAQLYKDVQFIYGPLCIYPVNILHTIGLPYAYSYYFCLGLYQTLGLIFLYYILAKIKLENKERKIVFIIIAVVIYPYTQGFNGTILRYVVAPFLMCNFILNIRNRHILLNTFLSFTYPLLALFYSPEIGLCYIFTMSLWFLVEGIINKHRNNIIFFIANITALLIVLLTYQEFFSSVLQAGSGGSNFPFVPSYILLLYFLYVFTIAYYIGHQCKRLKNEIESIGLEVLMLSMILAAAGRCDPIHVLSFGLLLIVLTYVVLKKYIAVILLRIGIFIIVIIYLFSLRSAIDEHLHVAARSNKELVLNFADKYIKYKMPGYQKITKKISTLSKDVNNFNALDSIDGSVTSIWVTADIYMSLIKTKEYKDNFFGYTLKWIGTKVGFDREIESLETLKPEYLVLPLDYKKKWLSMNDYNMINLLFCTYYPISPKRSFNEVLYSDLLKYININYCEITRDDKVVVLRHN